MPVLEIFLILGEFEAIISKSESGWLVGQSLTWTDIFAANHLSNWAKFLGDENTDLLKDKYPNLSKLVEGFRIGGNFKMDQGRTRNYFLISWCKLHILKLVF
ncbi:Glutathione S-transferase 3 [Folsomia candida]|uniref:Glutathione S-transferase 3 n=1 Tax=Folsomia candida TaxID=158441 RepID=A0A226E9B3_FOLCA|nr:Glutathione S-transferase 3 [Folsomia candida]